MKYEFITKTGAKHLLVIFAGWGMDSNLFRGLSHPSYDILAVWDYRTIDELPDIDHYDQICILAWSLGVLAAQKVFKHKRDNLGRCIAVNGTPWPVDDEKGIPVNIFQGTLDNLNERNLVKFQRRMCGDDITYARFKQFATSRELEDLKEELNALGNLALEPQDASIWDLAIISLNDAIFPVKNQRNAWSNIPSIEYEWPHFPEFGYLISRFLIDKPLVGKRFTEAVGTYDNNASVQAAIAADLWQEICLNGWAEKHPRFPSSYNSSTVIEIGPGTGIFTALYAPDIDGNCDWQLWDIADVSSAAHWRNSRFIQCDAECAIRDFSDSSVDYILSNCAVQWFNSPQRFLEECARVLKPDGVLAFSTFDPANLPELRKAMPDVSILSTPTSEQWKGMMPESLELLSLKQGTHPLLFSTPRDVLEHLRATGVNALTRPSVSSLRGFMENYPRLFNGCPLTYISLVIIMRRHL